MFKNYSNYEVYSDGRIWSYKTKRFLKPQTNNNGYQRVQLYDNEGKPKLYLLHRVVWEAVTGEPIPEGLQVNHIDEDKTNNHINNLNLMSHKDNVNWGTRTERCSKQVGAFKNNELVLVFPSTREAGRQGFKQSHISECCNGERKTHKGFVWKYLDDDEI